MTGTEFDADKMLKMFQAAQSMANTMNAGADKLENAENLEPEASFDYEAALRAVEMFKTLQASANSGAAARERDSVPPGNSTDYFEAKIKTPELLTIKAVIPFLEEKYRLNLSAFVKIIETQRLLDAYKETQNDNLDEGWRERMLMAVRPSVPEKKRGRIDILVKLLEIENIMSKIQGENENVKL